MCFSMKDHDISRLNTENIETWENGKYNPDTLT